MIFARVFCLVSVLGALAQADVPSRVATSEARLTPIQPRPVAADQDYLRGVQIADGHDVPQNYALAAKYYRKAADRGNVAAQYNLAYLYENGLGVARDLKQAAIWYRRAALQGDAEAQNNLGALYATGGGVPRSDAEAVSWYRLAANQNNADALSNLGAMYLEGRSVKRDFDLAFQLFEKSAGLGYAIAQNNLALMYANGQSVDRDYAQAYAWLEIAAEQIPECKALRDQIGKEMTPDEITRALALAAAKREQISKRTQDSQQ